MMVPLPGPRSARHLLRDTRGASTVEYILLAGVVALIVIASFKLFGGTARATLDEQAESGAVSGRVR